VYRNWTYTLPVELTILNSQRHDTRTGVGSKHTIVEVVTSRRLITKLNSGVRRNRARETNRIETRRSSLSISDGEQCNVGETLSDTIIVRPENRQVRSIPSDIRVRGIGEAEAVGRSINQLERNVRARSLSRDLLHIH